MEGVGETREPENSHLDYFTSKVALPFALTLRAASIASDMVAGVHAAIDSSFSWENHFCPGLVYRVRFRPRAGDSSYVWNVHTFADVHKS